MAGTGPVPTGRPRQKVSAANQPKFTILPPFKADEIDKPELPRKPKGSWSEMTLWWWDDVWSSPMAREYTESDHHGLYRLAVIVDDFWQATAPDPRIKALVEIRLQSQQYGLSPLDRSRLRWEVEKGDAADKRTRQRRDDEKPVTTQDPRAGLRAT